MWRTYADTADVWFKNATQVIDKYHWIRQAVWAFENIRKTEQKKLSPELRKYFKRSKSLLIKRSDKLNEEQRQQVDVMLYYSANISRAYWYKEEFLKILTHKEPESARNAYGYKNFNRFRNRILHIFSHKQYNNEQAAA